MHSCMLLFDLFYEPYEPLAELFYESESSYKKLTVSLNQVQSPKVNSSTSNILESFKCYANDTQLYISAKSDTNLKA